MTSASLKLSGAETAVGFRTVRPAETNIFSNPCILSALWRTRVSFACCCCLVVALALEATAGDVPFATVVGMPDV